MLVSPVSKLHLNTHKPPLHLILLLGQSALTGIIREFGKVTYTLLNSKWMTSKDLLYSTWKSAQCYVTSWMGEGLGRKWIHIYVWLSLFTVHLKLPQHC